MEHIEAQRVPILMPEAGSENHGRSRKLYHCLGTLLQGKLLRLVQSVKDQNGFEAFRLILTEMEPRERGQGLGLLMEIISQPSFDGRLPLIDEIRKFETKVNLYEVNSGQKVADDVKAATLIRCSPKEVQMHLHMVVTATTSYLEVKTAIENYDRARRTWQGDPMDVSYLGKSGGKGVKDNKGGKDKGYGKNGKGYGKDGKGPGKNDKGFGKTKSHGKFDKGYGKPDKGYGKKGKDGKWNDKDKCNICGKAGHYAAQCWWNKNPRQISELTGNELNSGTAASSVGPGSSVSNTLGVANISGHELGDLETNDLMNSTDEVNAFLFNVEKVETVEVNEFGGKTRMNERVMLDSGSCVHACPPEFGAHASKLESSGRQLDLRGAGGEKLTYYGERTVLLDCSEGTKAKVKFDVAAVRRPLLSVGKMVNNGHRVIFDANGSGVVNKKTGEWMPIVYDRGLFFLDAKVMSNIGENAVMGVDDDDGEPRNAGSASSSGNGVLVSGEPRAARRAPEPEEDQHVDDQDMRGDEVAPRVRKAPEMPSAQEVKEHEALHLPYKSWCDICKKSKGKIDSHYKHDDSRDIVGEYPVVQADYLDLDGIKVLVAVDVNSGFPAATVVPKKGIEESSIVWGIKLLNFLGHPKVIIQTDPEKPLGAWATEVAKKCGRTARTRESPRGSPASNGVAERAIQMLEGQIRSLRFQLEKKLDKEVDINKPLFVWLIKHSAWALGRFQPTRGGPPAWSVLHGGRPYQGPVVEFGEKVMAYENLDPRIGKAKSKWIEGFFLGKTDESDEFVICVDNEARRFRSIKRLSDETNRWSSDELERITALPWRPDGRRDYEQPWRPRSAGLAPVPLPKTEGCLGCQRAGRHHLRSCPRHPKNRGVVPQPGAASQEEQHQEQQEKKDEPSGKRVKFDDNMDVGEAASGAASSTSAPSGATTASSSSGGGHGEIRTNVSDPGHQQAVRRRITHKRPAGGDGDGEPANKYQVVSILEEMDNWDDDEVRNIQALENSEQTLDHDMTPEMIYAGDCKEFDNLMARGTFEEVPWDEAIKSGRRMIATRVVRRLRSGVCKSRLVAKDFADGSRPAEFYASTPSLQTLKTVLVDAARKVQESESKNLEPHGLMLMDATSAFLQDHLPQEEWVYLIPPPEYKNKQKMKGKIALLAKRPIYGLRISPRRWQELLRSSMNKAGLKEQKCDENLYVGNGIVAVAHVDDILISGPLSKIRSFVDSISKYIEATFSEPIIKVNDSGMMLGRQIVRINHGYKIVTSGRFAEEVALELNLARAKSVDTPMTSKSVSANDDENDPPLSGENYAIFRRCLGKMLYAACDRMDLQFATKTLAKVAHAPQESHMTALKRLCRYVKKFPKVEMEFVPVTASKKFDIRVVVDASWGDDKSTMRSTSGGYVELAGCVVSSWSRTQATVAMSSGEAEMNACVSGAMEGIIVRDILACLGYEQKLIVLETDSAAAKGGIEKGTTASRMRHVALRVAYLKELLKSAEIRLQKVSGIWNGADMLTKPVAKETLERLKTVVPVKWITEGATKEGMNDEVNYVVKFNGEVNYVDEMNDEVNYVDKFNGAVNYVNGEVNYVNGEVNYVNGKAHFVYDRGSSRRQRNDLVGTKYDFGKQKVDDSVGTKYDLGEQKADEIYEVNALELVPVSAGGEDNQVCEVNDEEVYYVFDGYVAWLALFLSWVVMFILGWCGRYFYGKYKAATTAEAGTQAGERFTALATTANIVYVTAHGECFHLPGCPVLRDHAARAKRACRICSRRLPP
ncbi:MAG: reverse transcriptase domain-containing protein [Methyloceanibacter sp.]|nr:reverse transcriptase domain-containing protein [Methyloceanibacter sp.]